MKKLITILLTIFLTFCVVGSVNSSTKSNPQPPVISEDPLKTEWDQMVEIATDLYDLAIMIHWGGDVKTYQEKVERISSRLEEKWNIPENRYYVELDISDKEMNILYLGVYVTSKIDTTKGYTLIEMSIDITKEAEVKN